jgi:Na+-transporting NADH:ubiquinone oxidoreductase subunit B
MAGRGEAPPPGAAPHLRSPFDLSRLRAVFAVALLPCLAMAVYNTGLQANRAIAAGGAPLPDGRAALLALLGAGFDPRSFPSCLLLGAAYFVPLALACAAGAWLVEAANARLRGRPASATWPLFGILLALTLPPTTPLWQALLGAAFGTLFGQEIFGGPGMSFIHPVLLGRAFLFFAYPAAMSGDAPWIAASFADVDGFSGATPLSRAMLAPDSFAALSWWDAFVGFIPGSMGETSALACLAGAAVLIAFGVASPWTMAGVALGTAATCALLARFGPDTFLADLPFHWHVVSGSWAFATVYLATDPASSPFTNGGRLVFGAGIGILAIVIRVANPAYAEGMMLAILFMNVFAPLINHATVQIHARRRRRLLARRAVRSDHAIHRHV